MKTLFRPVGLYEMKLIIDEDLCRFPPRLPEQPIFYPVLNKPYADQIALEWNTKDKFSGYAGYVTQFEVDEEYISQFEEQIVGTSKHKELWIPSEELHNFNRHIHGGIRILDAYYGERYEGLKPDDIILAGMSANEQIVQLGKCVMENTFFLTDEMPKIWKHVCLNFRYWEKVDPSLFSVNKDELLAAIKEAFEEYKGHKWL